MKYKNIEVYVDENQMDIFEQPVNLAREINNTDYDEMFDLFYNAGMRKLNKKKALQAFLKVVKSQDISPWEATQRLVEDVQKRLAANQFGFDRMHPTTYLNGERWEDEHVKEEVSSLTASTRDITTEQLLNDRSWAN